MQQKDELKPSSEVAGASKDSAQKGTPAESGSRSGNIFVGMWGIVKRFFSNAGKYLFITRRHPFRDIPSEYTPDTDKNPDKYIKKLNDEGFVTAESSELADYPGITHDLEHLEKHLLPIFWIFDQKAKHYQNVFYHHQWSFILGAFITTVAAILTNSSRPMEGGDASNFHTIIGIVTIITSLWTTYAAIMTNHNQPRKRWINYRRLAEDLRMTYYKYLSHIEPFNNEDRTQKLRRHVLEIRKKEPAING